MLAVLPEMQLLVPPGREYLRAYKPNGHNCYLVYDVLILQALFMMYVLMLLDIPDRLEIFTDY